MILNIPSDMFFLFIIRMDYPMVESILNEDEEYSGMKSEAFSAFMKQKIDYHKSLGDTTLLALPGKIGNTSKPAYSFLGNHSKEGLGIAIEVNDKKEMTAIVADDDFAFDEFPFNVDDF